MAFFKSFQPNISLPSMSSLVDSLSSAVDDLTSAVGEVSYTVADSVTEQVTSMINNLRTDETSRTQEDKSVMDSEENRTQVNNDKEKYRRESSFNAEEKHKRIDSIKQNTSDGRELYTSDGRELYNNINKMQNPHHAIEPKGLPNDAEIYKKVNNAMKHSKCKRHTGSEDLNNDTFPNDSQNRSTFSTNASFNKESSKGSHGILVQFKDQLPRSVKQRSSGIDQKDTEEGHGVASRNLEANEVQISKLPDSSFKKVYGVHEIKAKKPKILSDGHSQSVKKQEEKASSTLPKEGEKGKHKDSERFSKEVSSKKTPEKGEVSCHILSI